MRAIIHTQYGPPRVAQLKEIAKPLPADKELLIKVVASTVNRTDCGFRSAEYFISRLFSGLFKPKFEILGNEFAGIIEAVGNDVTLFNIGDKVFGYNDSKFGAHAEYITLPENGSLTTKPKNMSYEEAAAVCDGLMLGINLIRKIDFTKAKRNIYSLVLILITLEAIVRLAVIRPSKNVSLYVCLSISQ